MTSQAKRHDGAAMTEPLPKPSDALLPAPGQPSQAPGDYGSTTMLTLGRAPQQLGRTLTESTSWLASQMTDARRPKWPGWMVAVPLLTMALVLALELGAVFFITLPVVDSNGATHHALLFWTANYRAGLANLKYSLVVGAFCGHVFTTLIASANAQRIDRFTKEYDYDTRLKAAGEAVGRVGVADACFLALLFCWTAVVAFFGSHSQWSVTGTTLYVSKRVAAALIAAGFFRFALPSVRRAILNYQRRKTITVASRACLRILLITLACIISIDSTRGLALLACLALLAYQHCACMRGITSHVLPTDAALALRRIDKFIVDSTNTLVCPESAMVRVPSTLAAHVQLTQGTAQKHVPPTAALLAQCVAGAAYFHPSIVGLALDNVTAYALPPPSAFYHTNTQLECTGAGCGGLVSHAVIDGHFYCPMLISPSWWLIMLVAIHETARAQGLLPERVSFDSWCPDWRTVCLWVSWVLALLGFVALAVGARYHTGDSRFCLDIETYSVLGPAAAVLMLFTLLWKDSVHAALRGRQHSDIEENPWVFVSAPEVGPNGEKVMDWLQICCLEHRTLCQQGFDWATSGNVCPNDTEKWKEMKPFIDKWQETIASHPERAKTHIQEMAPIMDKTDWFANYRGKVQGALQAACQRSPNGMCYAICVDGGPVSRVESILMDVICSNVHVYGMVHPQVQIKRFKSLEDLKRSFRQEVELLGTKFLGAATPREPRAG